MLNKFVLQAHRSRQREGNAGYGIRLALVILVLVLVVGMSLTTMAAAPSAFSVQAVIPENQIDSRHTYFDLKVSPGDRQVLQIAITNSEEQEVEANVALCPASTAQNGLIVYTDPDVRDESLDLAITDFATVTTPVLTIAPGGTVVAEVHLEVPGQPFQGVVLGGVSVTADYTEQQDEEEQQDGFQIENRYAYVIGLKLQEDLEDQQAEPDFHLKDIQPGLVNYRQALLINLQQSEPFIANHLEVSAQVTKAGEPDFIRTLELSNAQMAPNSNGDFVIDWEAPIAPGTYHLLMQVEREGRIWKWDEEFVIADKVAEQMNTQSVVEYKAAQAALPVWIIVLLVILLLMVILLLILLKQNKSAPHPPHSGKS